MSVIQRLNYFVAPKDLLSELRVAVGNKTQLDRIERIASEKINDSCTIVYASATLYFLIRPVLLNTEPNGMTHTVLGISICAVFALYWYGIFEFSRFYVFKMGPLQRAKLYELQVDNRSSQEVQVVVEVKKAI